MEMNEMTLTCKKMSFFLSLHLLHKVGRQLPKPGLRRVAECLGLPTNFCEKTWKTDLFFGRDEVEMFRNVVIQPSTKSKSSYKRKVLVSTSPSPPPKNRATFHHPPSLVVPVGYVVPPATFARPTAIGSPSRRHYKPTAGASATGRDGCWGRIRWSQKKGESAFWKDKDENEQTYLT